MKKKLNAKNFLSRVAVLLVMMLMPLTTWAQFASTSDGWVIEKSNDGTRCLLKEWQPNEKILYAYSIKAYPAIIDGAAVVTITNKDIEPKEFPNIDTLYMYNDFEYNEMPSAKGCSKLKKIILVDRSGKVVGEDSIPAAITSIPDFAFYGCNSLENIRISKNVTNIGEGTFSYCYSLKNITVPNSVKTIGENAFERCDSLKSITIPNSVTSIGGGAFLNCSSLENITIPNGVTSIGTGTSSGCSSLESITIPNSVTSIDTWAFAYCPSLATATIMGNPSIVSNAFSAEATVILNLPSTIDIMAKVSQNALEYEGWTTFSNGYAAFKADDETMVYKATVKDGRLALTEVKDKTVDAGATVLLRRKDTSNFVLTKTTTPSTDTHVNELQGTEQELQMIKDGLYDYYYDIEIEVAPDDNYGSAAASTLTAKEGDKVTVSASAKEGYVFRMWNSSMVKVTNYFKEETTFTMPKKDVTITATFCASDEITGNTYKLTLDANDGAPFGMAEIMTGSDTYTLPARTRANYVFLGWATSPTAEDLDPDLTAGKEITLTANVTLYGVWMSLTETVTLADDADNSVKIAKLIELDSAENVMLQGRTLYKDGTWNTICLPFAASLTDENSPLYGATAKALSSASITENATGETLNLTFGSAAETLVAGVPYIIKWAKANDYVDDDDHNIVNPVFSGVTITTAEAGNRTFTSDGYEVSFLGTYSPATLAANTTSNLFLGANNKLHYPTQEGYKVNAFRAYFTIANANANAKAITDFVVDFGDGEEVTGINEAEADSSLFTLRSSLAGWYGIDGRPLNSNPTAKGIYIHNGKKVVLP